MAFSRRENKGVARNLPPASLEVLAKPRSLPGFQRFREVFAELLGQRSEVISLPGAPWRAGTPAGATAPSDWPFCVALPRRCAGEPAVTYHKSMSQAGTTRSREVSARVGVTNDEAENPPRLRVTNGEDSQESKPPVKRRAKTHTASIQDSSTPVPWRWGSRTGNRRLQGTTPQTGSTAYRW